MTRAKGLACLPSLLLAGCIGTHVDAKPTTPHVSSPDPCEVARHRLFDSLRGPVDVHAFVTTGTPERSAFVDAIRTSLARDRDESGGKLNVTITDVNDEASRNDAKNEKLLEKAWDAAPTGNPARIFMGVVFTYGSTKATLGFLPPDAQEHLDLLFASKLAELRDTHDAVVRTLGVLTGHGELGLTEENLMASGHGKPTTQGIITLNFPFYRFVDVDLRGGERAIDPSLDGLIVTQPSKDLNEAELRQIDRFILAGKRAVFFTSAVNVAPADPLMSATLNAHGIDKLLAGYGIELHKDVVLDFERTFKMEVPTSSGIATLRIPSFPVVAADPSLTKLARPLDTSFPVFALIHEVAFPFASSLTLHQEAQPTAKMRVLARSSARSFAQASAVDVVDLRMTQAWKPSGVPATFDLAVSVDGTLTTAFPAGGAASPKPPSTARRSRVFVVASSQFLANPVARANNGHAKATTAAAEASPVDSIADAYAQSELTDMILVFKNTLDWLTLAEEQLECIKP